MNQKKAKALRKQIGFVPAAERRYAAMKRGYQVQILATGERHWYQQVKRGRV